MERRRDLRVKADQKVLVTALSNDRQQMEATAVDLSGRGISLFVPMKLTTGAPVRIELDDALLLGEICYCRPECGGFVIDVEIDQALAELEELARLNRALLGTDKEDSGVGRERGALSYSLSE